MRRKDFELISKAIKSWRDFGADPAGLIERVLLLARRQPLTDAERHDCDMLEDFAVNYLGDD